MKTQSRIKRINAGPCRYIRVTVFNPAGEQGKSIVDICPHCGGVTVYGSNPLSVCVEEKKKDGSSEWPTIWPK